jgi:hypothetical protein
MEEERRFAHPEKNAGELPRRVLAGIGGGGGPNSSGAIPCACVNFPRRGGAGGRRRARKAGGGSGKRAYAGRSPEANGTAAYGRK